MKHISTYTNMNTFTDRQNQKLVLSFLIGVLVGLGIFWMVNATRQELSPVVGNVKNTEESSQKAAVQDFTTTPLVRDNAIIVENQPAGSRVFVKKAMFEEDGWVVIHEGNTSFIGNALGAARFDAGENSGVVELLRNTEVGKMYRAILYRDNGDRTFSLENDFPFLGTGNQPILTTFIAL